MKKEQSSVPHYFSHYYPIAPYPPSYTPYYGYHWPEFGQPYPFVPQEPQIAITPTIIKKQEEPFGLQTHREPKKKEQTSPAPSFSGANILPTIAELQNIEKGKLRKYWTVAEDRDLVSSYQKHGGNWEMIAQSLTGRNEAMCYSRYRRLQLGKKKYWSEEDDAKIKELVEKLGFQWKLIAKQIPDRNPKQIREHYLNFLRPNIDKTPWTPEEDLKICQLVMTKGKCWKSFEEYLPGRIENQIKGRFYGHLKKNIYQKSKRNKESEGDKQDEAFRD